MTSKINDDDVLVAGTEIMAKYIEVNKAILTLEFDPLRSPETEGGKVWEHEVLVLYRNLLGHISGSDPSTSTVSESKNADGTNRDRDSPSVIKMNMVKKANFNKNTPRILNGILDLLEFYYSKNGVNVESKLNKEILLGAKNVVEGMPNRASDTGRRMEKMASMARGGVSASQGGDSSLEEIEEKKKAANANANASGISPKGSSRKGGSTGGSKTSRKDTPLQSLVYPTYISSSGYAIPKVWRTEDDADESDGIVKRLLPLHPLQFFQRQAGQLDHEVPRLLDTWPSYLERLVLNPNAGKSKSKSEIEGSFSLYCWHLM